MRVVILDVPAMLRELLVRALTQRAEVQVRVLDSESLPQAAPAPAFDLAIVELPGGELSPAGQRLLEQASRPKVLGLLDDGRQGHLFELQPHRTALGELSEQVLARVLDSVTPVEPTAGGQP